MSQRTNICVLAIFFEVIKMSKEIENIENLINQKNVEFRDFKIGNIEIRKDENTNTEEMIVTGVPCVFDNETVLYKSKYYELREKIDKNAFDEADMTDVIFNYNHGGRVYAKIRNKSLTLSVKKDGLHMEAKLMPEDEGHCQMYRDIKTGLLDRMSFAFTVKESKREETEINNEATIILRTITKIDKLYDVSAVDIPAYDATSISARKVFEAESEIRRMENALLQAESLKRKLLILTEV